MNTRPSPIFIALIYVALSYVLSLLTSRLDGSTKMLEELYDQYLLGNFTFFPERQSAGAVAWILIFALDLMSMTLSAGFTSYCMRISKGEKAGYRNLMDGFGFFLRLLGLSLLMGLFIMLWSLLFVIPGIIAAYRYRMALYIMIDNPELGVLDCISRSKNMMRGRKGELFVLDLSFIGWRLLTVIPLVSVWVNPYTEITYVGYYMALRDGPQVDYVV